MHNSINCNTQVHQDLNIHHPNQKIRKSFECFSLDNILK